MVRMPIKSFVVQVILEASRRQKCNTLIDSGCTRCLMSAVVTFDLGLGLQRLAQPIRFEQMDGPLLGVQPAMHVTEKLVLELGQHREFLWFLVVSQITEEVVLGLAWLDNWGPMI